MRGCERCRVSGWDRRWDCVDVAGVLYSKGGGEGKVADREGLVGQIPLN